MQLFLTAAKMAAEVSTAYNSRTNEILFHLHYM